MKSVRTMFLLGNQKLVEYKDDFQTKDFIINSPNNLIHNMCALCTNNFILKHYFKLLVKVKTICFVTISQKLIKLLNVVFRFYSFMVLAVKIIKNLMKGPALAVEKKFT